MRSSPRVLHVITGLHLGGAELMLTRLADAMRSHGLDSEVISLMKLVSNATRPGGGVPVHFLDIPRGRLSLGAARHLSQLSRRIRPALAQGWMYHGNLAASWAAWSTAATWPVVWNVRHSLYELALEPRLTRAVIRLGARLSRKPAAIIYNSRTSARQHEAFGYSSDRTIVIPNGFDCERFRPRPGARERLRAELGVEPDAILIGMVARNHPMKDVGNLLHAMALLKSGGVDADLVIVGRDYDAREMTESGTAGVDAARTVRLLGERKDVHEILPAFDVAVLPSAWGEGFPNVLGEAMASEVPCVATDVGDSAWILSGHGIVVPPRDSPALAAALRRMIELGPEARKKLGEQGRARVVAEFAMADVTRRYVELYEAVIERSGKVRA